MGLRLLHQTLSAIPLRYVVRCVWTGSFSNDNGDSNETVKKVKKTTILHLYHAFLYISLPSLHNYDVNMPHFTFYGGRKQATTNFSFSSLTWERSPRNHLQGKGGWLHLTSQFQSYLNPLPFTLPYYSLPISTPATPAITVCTFYFHYEVCFMIRCLYTWKLLMKVK